ncbi:MULTISPECIES: hypothetical protein [unclassified Methylobacterium]|uniref:hypothetical protein n=1 Tax=unclassified Methylobacterium TaxID=2615210 RepID=UPI00128FBEE8|nr:MULTISPECIES: hypothetical protein [unclassified Methylobacterium]MCJ2102261.1 hypothetical protein [Methylobacterium sp. E-046]
MFTPPDHLYAARKVALTKRMFEEAGHPLSQDDCRRIVALAWGYASWNHVKTAMDEGYAPGPFDEALAGEDFLMAPADAPGAMIVARRRGSTGNAVRAVTRLPFNVCDSFSSHVRLTNDPTARSGRKEAAPSSEAWLTPVQFAEKVKRGSQPPPAILAEFARSLASATRDIAPFVPLLPGQRPHR